MGWTDKDVCRHQIRTKHRYVWTKRESTEEGSTLRELVDQVSLLTLQMSRAEVFSLAFWVVRCIQRKYCGSLMRSISSFLAMFLFLRSTNFPAAKPSSRLWNLQWHRWEFWTVIITDINSHPSGCMKSNRNIQIQPTCWVGGLNLENIHFQGEMGAILLSNECFCIS